MPNWTNDLPSSTKRLGFELRRTPADRPIRAIATSNDLHICWTHFWGGRTIPCEKPDCEACHAMSPSRAHCYLSAMDPATRDHFIFESTAGAAQPFADWIATYGTLRGCYFQAVRPKRRRNSKVEIICKPADLTKITLPAPPDIPIAMCTIWQIPGASVQSAGDSSSSPMIEPDSRQINRQRLCPADFNIPNAAHKGNGSE